MLSYNQFLLNRIFLTSGNQVPVNTGNLLFFGLFIMAVGLVSIIYPQAFWYLRVGRKLPGVPPSRLYLGVLRFGGLLVIGLAAIILYSIGNTNF